MDNKNDMSDTFIKEIGQKDAYSTGNTEVVPVEEINQVGTGQEVNSTNQPIQEVVTDNNQIGVVENNNNNIDLKPKKKKKGLAIFLFIFGLLLGGAGGYFSYQFINKEKKEPVKKNTVVKEKDDKEELVSDGIFVSELVSRYDSMNEEDDISYLALYSKDSVKVSDIDKDYIKYVAARNVSLDKSLSNFTSEKLHSAVTKLFGSDITIDDGDIVLPFSDKKEVLYSYTNSTYTVKNTNLPGLNNISFYKKIIKAEKVNDNLEVTVAVGIFDNNSDKVYKSMNEEGKYVDEAEGITVSSFDEKKDYSKLNKYKYKFKYDSEIDNYTLDSIELVK